MADKKTITLSLDVESYERLVNKAMAQRRTVPEQAAVLVLMALDRWPVRQHGTEETPDAQPPDPTVPGVSGEPGEILRDV